MKKILLSLGAIGLLLSSANAQRVSIVEDMGGENCPPCAHYIGPTEALIASTNGGAILLGYMVNIPSGGTLYNTTKHFVDSRRSYYGINSAPGARLNGQIFAQSTPNPGHPANLTKAMIDADNNAGTPIEITAKHEWAGGTNGDDSINVTVTVKAIGADYTPGSGDKLHVLLTEDLHYANPPGTTTQKDFNHTARQIIAGGNTWAGEPLTTTIKKDSMVTFTYSVARANYVSASNVTHIVAFVQKSDKTIINANQGPAAWRTSVKDVTVANNLTLYPNPATSEAHISADFATKTTGNVIVTDIAGRTVFNSGTLEFAAKNNTYTIPTSDLANGIYNVSLRTEAGVSTTRLTVVH